MHTGAPIYAHNHIKHRFEIYSCRKTEKESSLSKSISLAKICHSSFLSLIHLLIPLFLCHFIQMFPELVLVHGRLMSCWGLWHSATSFYPFTSCFVVSPFSQFGSLCMECMWVCLLCLCVCVLNLDRAVCLRTLLPQHQTPPAVVFSPPTPHICSCVFATAASCSPPPYFFLLCSYTEQGWEGCPVPTFGLSHSHKKHTRAPTHSQHMQSVSLHCLNCIWAQVVH